MDMLNWEYVEELSKSRTPGPVRTVRYAQWGTELVETWADSHYCHLVVQL